MRIEVLVLSGTGPVYDAVLRLGDVTVLTGRNDAGKTRVLRAIRSGVMASADAEWIEVHGIATPAEVNAFLTDPEMPPTGAVDAMSAAVEPFLDAIEITIQGDGMPVGVLGPEVGHLLHGWRYGYALSDLDETTRADVEQALLKSGIDEVDPDEPLKLEPLGGFDPRILPETITVPCSATDLELEVAGAVTRLTRALRAVASAWSRVQDVAGALMDGPPHDWGTHFEPTGEPSRIEPSWEWLISEPDNDITLVHPAANHACDAISRIAGGLLPGFIADDYYLRVILARPIDIARDRAIRIELQRRHSSDESPNGPVADGWFDLADAASGFTVWIQLALCETAQRAKRCSYLLQQHIHAVRRTAEQGREQTGGVTYSWEEIRDGFTAEDTSDRDEIVAHRLDGLGIQEHKHALEGLLGWLADPRRALPASLEQSNFQPAGDDGEEELLMDDVTGAVLEPVPRGRLYLLDEPEQRLHPLLQRQAARWLSTLMSRWETQCVLATHSVAFMSLGDGTHAYEITRGGDLATVLPLDPLTLTPYSQLAREMGLDRGELLSLARAFLITPRPIAVLLEEFYAARLAASQITLIPVEDDQHAADFLAAALLARVTAAPLAALLTSITPQQITELREADAGQRARAAAQGSEAAATVALIDDSIRHGHEIEILTLNTPNVLDLLNEDVIAHAVTGPEPFPGHQAAHDLHLASDLTYPQFLSATYGIRIINEFLRSTARRMRDAHPPEPDALGDAVWRVEQLALSSEQRPPQRR